MSVHTFADFEPTPLPAPVNLLSNPDSTSDEGWELFLNFCKELPQIPEIPNNSPDDLPELEQGIMTVDAEPAPPPEPPAPPSPPSHPAAEQMPKESKTTPRKLWRPSRSLYKALLITLLIVLSGGNLVIALLANKEALQNKRGSNFLSVVSETDYKLKTPWYQFIPQEESKPTYTLQNEGEFPSLLTYACGYKSGWKAYQAIRRLNPQEKNWKRIFHKGERFNIPAGCVLTPQKLAQARKEIKTLRNTTQGGMNETPANLKPTTTEETGGPE